MNSTYRRYKRYNHERAQIEVAEFTVDTQGYVIVTEETMAEMLNALGFEENDGQDFQIRPTYQSQ